MEIKKPSMVDSFLATGSESASIFSRWIALLIDGLITTAISASTIYTLNIEMGVTFQVSSIIVAFLYSGFFTSQRGATPGKMVMKIKIVNQVDGLTPSFIVAGLRDGIGHTISGLILFLGYIMAFFNDDKISLHDYIFKTKVVKVAPQVRL